MELLPGSGVTTEKILRAIRQHQPPFYLYNESTILQKCDAVLSMPNAFGLSVYYAMKANSNRAILQLITGRGLGVDTSSLNEVRRASLAGMPLDRIILTTQEVPLEDDRRDLEDMILQGLKYNVCSFHQLELIADFAARNKIRLSMRIHPGLGTGESATRNTGDDYASFGIHLTDIEKATAFSRSRGLVFDELHSHIGSGGDPEIWRQNVGLELDFVEKYFADVETVNFGGGFKAARMPDEKSADVQELGSYAKERFEKFFKKTGRKLTMAVEPGTFIMANAGYIVATVIDKKQTGPQGYEFLVLNAGMEANARPLMYGSRHPFYIISKDGKLLSNEFTIMNEGDGGDSRLVVGRCCESGDCQCLDISGKIQPRQMADAEIGDYVIIGGAGAYCSSMAPFNYNSYTQIPELLLRQNGEVQVIREGQTLQQIVINERGLL
jgi:diaminopimelate decarboxylase